MESVLQSQVAAELSAQGFSVGGEVLPPVLFRYSQIPMGLVISPRNVIRQDANIQLIPGLTLEQQIELESEVEQKLGVSALVVPLGGLGTYPTMIMESSWINWVVEAVSHEWTHIYLYFTPLGQQYETSGEMRTINETAASLVGKAIGALVIEHNYPELVPPPPAARRPGGFVPSRRRSLRRSIIPTRCTSPGWKPTGCWRREKSTRRNNTWKRAACSSWSTWPNTAITSAGSIRRSSPFTERTPTCRGNAAKIPIGPAVVKLYDQCPSVGAFLRAISKVTSFRQLQDITAAGGRCG